MVYTNDTTSRTSSAWRRLCETLFGECQTNAAAGKPVAKPTNSERERDKVGTASEDSFPASDPPSFYSGRGEQS